MVDNKRLQIRKHFADGQLHFQGIGIEMNREYGLAVDIRVPHSISDWMVNQEATLDSAAGGGNIYIPAEMKQYEVDDKIQYQLFIKSKSGDILNHPDGAMLNMKPKSNTVAQLIDFCIQNKLVVVDDGVPFVGEQDE